MEITVAVLCLFGVYLVERTLLAKRQAVVIREDVQGQVTQLQAEISTQVTSLQGQLDQQRERLNRIEARR